MADVVVPFDAEADETVMRRKCDCEKKKDVFIFPPKHQLASETFLPPLTFFQRYTVACLILDIEWKIKALTMLEI
jgi:hypothetical protein